MGVPPENTLTDPEQLIADLQRHFAERDEAPQREIGTAEVCRSSIPRPATSPQYSRPAGARQALGNDKDACGRPPRGSADRSGRRVGRIWTPAISTHDGLVPIA